MYADSHFYKFGDFPYVKSTWEGVKYRCDPQGGKEKGEIIITSYSTHH